MNPAPTLAGLPADRVVQVRGGDPGRIALLAAHGGPDLPAVLSHRIGPGVAGNVAAVVDVLLDDLEEAAIALFPAWLPAAAHIDSPGGAGIAAVRALAAERAAETAHFGPLLADLAAGALSGVPVRRRFSPEVRARGLVRAVADGLGRSRLVLVVHVPDGLRADQERALASGTEWLADRAGLGIWLCGTPLATVDRLTAASMPGAGAVPQPSASPGTPGVDGGVPDASLAQSLVWHGGIAARGAGDAALTAGIAALTAGDAALTAGDGPPPAGMVGRPHPGSVIETALEAALARHPWAAGREWNQTYQSHALASPVRLDLLWRAERCVVEVDGPEHCHPVRFEADRQRDVQLQIDGFAVLRFTNARVRHDVEAVVRQIGSFIHQRRHELLRGHRP